jgi:3'(2'), 5'-bisphosphate nucleotidase
VNQYVFFSAVVANSFFSLTAYAILLNNRRAKGFRRCPKRITSLFSTFLFATDSVRRISQKRIDIFRQTSRAVFVTVPNMRHPVLSVFEPEVSLARHLATEAGKVILKFYAEDIAVRWKDGREPVTAADQAASDFIVSELRRSFPDDIVISEEDADDLRRLTHPRVWFVDPLDGTREFIARNGEFSVMIGLSVDGRPAVGAVFQPTRHRLWCATPDAAWLETDGARAPLHVSSVAECADMRMVVSRSHRNRMTDAAASRLGVTREIVSGSGGIKLGLIANGEADVMFTASPNSKLWDTCAPEAILRAAGGEVTDFQGRALDYRQQDLHNRAGVVASNGLRHADIIRRISDVYPSQNTEG